MKILIILRGLPGSGKSTLASELGKAICTADDFFTKNGKYQWDGSQIGSAHTWCQRKCKRFMQRSIPKIIVANTSTTKKEIKPYFKLAKKFGYRVFSIIVENRHKGTNIHSVPKKSIKRMKTRFDIKL